MNINCLSTIMYGLSIHTNMNYTTYIDMYEVWVIYLSTEILIYPKDDYSMKHLHERLQNILENSVVHVANMSEKVFNRVDRVHDSFTTYSA